jgi:hypothetical protein
VTVAVRVTACPGVDGLELEESTVVVGVVAAAAGGAIASTAPATIAASALNTRVFSLMPSR